MADSGFQAVRWRPPAPSFPVPKRADPRTLPPLTLLPLPGTGPEHVAVDARGRLLTGLADGRIVRVDPEGGVDTVANTGGRPLGLELDGEDSLVVCDAERGLLRVRFAEPAERTGPAGVKVLCNSVHGRQLRFCSCPAIAADGTVYFSQSSQRYDLAHYKGDLMEHSGTGRVLRLRDGQVDIVADGLQFANGLVLAPDQSRDGGARPARLERRLPRSDLGTRARRESVPGEHRRARPRLPRAAAWVAGRRGAGVSVWQAPRQRSDEK